MIYLIDGYNLIFSLVESKGSLQALREKVIRYLQKKFATRKLQGVLVFDGAHQRGEESGLSYPSPLVVAYTPKGQSADEYIVEEIQLGKGKKQITVVTNDRGLKMHAKTAGANVLENGPFIAWLKKKKGKSEPKMIKESPRNVDQLEKIFEERLKKS